MTDKRKPIPTLQPIRRVTRAVEHPCTNERLYYVSEKVQDEQGNFAGWRYVSKGYRHSTSAFAALGRLVQKDIKD